MNTEELGDNKSDSTNNAPSDTIDRTPFHIHEAGRTEKAENLSMEKEQQKVQEVHCMLKRSMSLSSGPNIIMIQK